jgi:hypothetical protein
MVRFCFTIKKCSLRRHIRRGFDPTGQEIPLQADLQDLLRENVSSENMKNAIIYGSNLASSVWRNLGLKEWLL